MIDSFFLNGIILIETVFLFLSTRSKKRLVTLLTLGLLSALSLFLLLNHFDKNLITTTEMESIKVKERRLFFNNELGRIYGNRVGIFYFDTLRSLFGKLSNNLFSTLDLTRYFSSDLFSFNNKYPLAIAILSIFGIILFIADIKTIPLIYFLITLGVSCLIVPEQNLLLMLPLINIFILTGFIKLLEPVKKGLVKIT